MKLPAKIVRSSNGAPQFEVKYKDRAYRVKLFKFQENYPDDTPIECIVTRQPNDELLIRQDLQALINEFYTQGEDYEFEVRHDFSHNGYYELIDDHGLTFRLPAPKGMKLLTGSTVKCRIIAIGPNGAQLKLTDLPARQYIPATKQMPGSDSRELDVIKISDRIFRDLYPATEDNEDNDPAWDPDEIFGLLFLNSDYYDQAVSNAILDMIIRWRNEDDSLEWEGVLRRLEEIRFAVMYVLEGSDILLDIEPLRRKSLQKRLTILADNIVGYKQAAEHLSSGMSSKMVNRVLNCLRTSGYIYEAELQLDIMMRIFSLSPEVMVANLNEIFSIIHARTEDFWRDEPFRKAFVRLLQIYVERARKGIDTGLNNDTATIRSLIEALSIQLLLADSSADSDIFDYNLNLASLYRYASMLRTSVPENAVRNAFLALMDVARRPSYIYRWSETGAHDLMASKLTAMPVGLEEGFRKTYESRPVALDITEGGVILKRTDVNQDSLKTLDLNGVGIWPGLKVMTPQRIAAISSNSTDLRRAREMWNAIEKSLFSEDIDVKKPLQRRLSTPGKDDECSIRVISQIDDTTFAVEITNDLEYEGRGILTTEDMVHYKVPGLRMEHFLDEDGNKLVFMAKVKRSDDSGIHFSIVENLLDYSQAEMRNDNPMRCIIKSSNQYGKVGVSEWGDAVKFKPAGEFAAIKAGDVVIGNYWSIPTNAKEKNYIEGVVTEIVEDPDPFSTADAFHALLTDYSFDSFEEDDDSEENNENVASEEMLSDARMDDLMALVERKAAAESDYMKAFNHIAFARLLARMARQQHRREFYEAWMRLISILHHFAINGEIDASRLTDFETNDRSRFDSDSELYRRYLQLKVVSYKGQPHMLEELWRCMAHDDEEIRSLASNIMAYNLLADNASASVLGEIDDRINNILHVKTRTTTLYNFGSENKTTEFKSSLIFPPDNHMRANPEQQSHDIMKELCALLNADGGTLYLGVNDFGMGVGIENDLAYKDFNGSEDKYDLFFRRTVCKVLGRDADAYIDAEFIEKGGKKIYVVKVRPYYTAPLKVDGIIYERHGSSKLPFFDPEDIRRFTERRAKERDLILSRIPKNTEADKNIVTPATVESDNIPANAVSETPANTQTKSASAGKSKKNDAVEASFVKKNPARIATGVKRPVCPANYDPEHDPATVRYLEIYKDEFQMVSDFYGYPEEETDLLLVIPLKENNIRDWLVLGYADGTVCRVPMKLFFDKQDYTPGRRFTEVPLIFADVLSDDDAMVSLSRNANGNWNARADRTDALPAVKGMTNPGERMFNTQKEEYRFNTLSGAEILNFQDLFNRTNKDAGKNFTTSRHDRLYQQLKTAGFIS